MSRCIIDYIVGRYKEVQITDVQIKLLLSFILIFIITLYYINSKSFKEKNIGLIFTSFIQGLLLSVIFPRYVFYAPIIALVYYVIFYNIWSLKFLFKFNKLGPYNDETLIQSLNKFPEISHLKFKFRKYSDEKSLNANVMPTIPPFSNEYKISFGEKLISRFTLEEKIVVSAHEISHILKRHILVQGILQSVLFVVLALVSLGFNLIVLIYLKNYFVYFDYAITLIVLLAGIIGINIISWRNEYDANKMAILLTKDITNFESAYLKLDDEKYHNKDYGTIINLLVYSHPLLVNRIKRAKEIYFEN